MPRSRQRTLKLWKRLYFFIPFARPHFNAPRFFKKRNSSRGFHRNRRPPSPSQVAEGYLCAELSTLRTCMRARQRPRKTFDSKVPPLTPQVNGAAWWHNVPRYPSFQPCRRIAVVPQY